MDIFPPLLFKENVYKNKYLDSNISQLLINVTRTEKGWRNEKFQGSKSLRKKIKLIELLKSKLLGKKMQGWCVHDVYILNEDVLG